MLMTRLTVTVLLSGMFALPSVAADDPEEREQLFDTLDRNKDGLLQSEEVNEGQRRAFERLIRVGDANDDGQLSRAEYLKASGPEDPVTLEQAGRGQAALRGGQQRFDVDHLFERADQDGDGKIALDDLPEPAQQRLLPLFERIGKEELTREDFARMRPMPARRPVSPDGQRPQMALMRVLDEDGDGQLSQSELARLTERFVRLDRNGDGQLSPGELIGFPAGAMGRDGGRQRPEPSSRPERPRRPDDSPEGDRARPESNDRQRFQRFGPTQTVRRFDTDGDAALSREEAPDRLSARFDRIDANGDDKITADELQRALEAGRRNTNRN